MSIETLANTLQFLDIEDQYFEVNAGNDILVLTSSEGGPQNIDLADGTYDGASLATEIARAMNADATLTGGVITFAVTYSTTTYKFTLDATAAKTIAYTHSGSDAGLTCGFIADQAAAQTITSNTAASDPTAIVQTLLTEAENYISNYCRRTFESTAYTLERYDGKGYDKLNLRQYPVTIVDRVVIGVRDVISIKNTNTGTSASVSVLTTGLRLVLNGTVDATDVTFATNTTISAMVTAANAIGSGWVAASLNSTYNSFKSSDLVTQSGLGCINSRLAYLAIPHEQEHGVEADLDKGQLRLPWRFPKGFQNVFVDYTAGYSSDDMPSDLKLAVKIIVQYLYEKRTNTVFGIEFYNIGASGSTGLRTIFEKDFIMPKEAERILAEYKRWKV